MTIEGWGGHGNHSDENDIPDDQKEQILVESHPRTRKIVVWSEPPPAFREFRYHICEWYDDASQVVYNLKKRQCRDIMVYELGEARPEIVNSAIVSE